jgi:hypothetical protein
VIGVALAVDLLRFVPEAPRTSAFFRALIEAAPAAGIELRDVPARSAAADWLLLWGPGAPNRFPAMRAQLAAGGRVVCFDAAYWQRDEKFRVSIDAAHPQSWILKRRWPAERLQRDSVRIADRWNPNGPVIVAGLGDKARVQYGPVVVDAWERARIEEARAHGRRVLYRRKRGLGAVPTGVAIASDAPIDAVLDGASAVITYHSNVAVDAIRLGVPVICADGAAAAVSPATWPTAGAQPLSTEWRMRFLENLAWFQWAPREAPECWHFLKELLACA